MAGGADRQSSGSLRLRVSDDGIGIDIHSGAVTVISIDCALFVVAMMRRVLEGGESAPDIAQVQEVVKLVSVVLQEWERGLEGELIATPVERCFQEV